MFWFSLLSVIVKPELRPDRGVQDEGQVDSIVAIKTIFLDNSFWSPSPSLVETFWLFLCVLKLRGMNF